MSLVKKRYDKSIKLCIVCNSDYCIIDSIKWINKYINLIDKKKVLNYYLVCYN